MGSESCPRSNGVGDKFRSILAVTRAYELSSAADRPFGGIFSAALSLALQRVGVTDRPAL